MTDPTYSFTIPSIHDDTPLDCRIHQPDSIDKLLQRGTTQIKGAIVTHPYGPLGGCYDDEVVTSITAFLLEQGYIVITFNFRGAGDSAGKTSWTGKPEVDDYSTVVGLLVYYLQHLPAPTEADTLSPVFSSIQTAFGPESSSQTPSHSVQLLLAGYSYGSLILARLPAVSTIINKFESAERGTAASEVFLRARTLAKQTRQSVAELERPQTPRGRDKRHDSSPTKSPRASPITVGGEETNPSERRRSRDSRRSTEIMMEVPHQIKSHMKRHSRHQQNHETTSTTSAVDVRYLMISPVLVPMSTTLLSPGIPFTSGSATEQQDAGLLSLKSPALVVFGSSDTFTSSKKLGTWSERLAKQSSGRLEWAEIAGAGHFWREKGVMRALQSKICSWLNGL